MINLKREDCIEERCYYIVIRRTYIGEKEAVEAVDEYLREKYCVELTSKGRNLMLRPFIMMRQESPYKINLKMVAVTEREFYEAAEWFSLKGIMIEKGLHTHSNRTTKG